MIYIQFLVLRVSHNDFGLSKLTGIVKKVEPTQYAQIDLLLSRSIRIFIVNTNWYCSIIHLEVSKKISKRRLSLG